MVCSSAPTLTRPSLRAASSQKPTMCLLALTTGREGLQVQICLHSSLEQLRTEPLNAISFFNIY